MRLKKVQMTKKLRIAVIVIFGLLFAGSLYYTCTVFRKPVLVDKPVPIYSYTQKGNLSYNVQLKPNSVFPEKTLGPGKTYFTKLVESIDAVFSYNFKADRAASLKATYSIIATVDAPKMWQKEFILVPQTDAFAEGNTLSINRAFSIDLASYNNFLKAVNEELGASASEPKLVINVPVYLKAVSSRGTVEDKLAPTMSIPLTSGCFQVSGTLSPKKNGALMVAKKVADPALVAKKKMAAVSPAVVGLLLMLLFLLTTGKTQAVTEGKQREIDLLAKTYGDRMVQVQGDFLLPDDILIVSLGSSGDLGKVADELGKPVIYQPSGPQGIPCYLVIDGFTAYRYVITGQTGFKSSETEGWNANLTPVYGANRPVSSS